MQNALLGGTQRFYANGMGMAMTATDISVVLSVNSVPGIVIDLSFGMAKELAANLTNAVSAYEQATNSTVKTPSQMQEAMREAMANLVAHQPK